MKTSKPPANRSNQKGSQQHKQSSGMLRIFSVIMLLLLAISSLGRVTAGSRAKSRSGQTSNPQGAAAIANGTAARILVFHREGSSTGLCEDLVITVSGDAVNSTCGNGTQKQYTLSVNERKQLQGWIDNFQAVNYAPNAEDRTGGTKIQLFLYGQGSQPATDADTQRIIDFAIALDAKIVSQS